jgi:phage replication-related protein YjqB (UPF0714/DUF867 family)
VLVAPHGGGIEPGTSEIAEHIAGEDLSLGLFEGRKPRGNGVLHITSTHFDEPRCLALVRSAQNVIAVHGERGDAPTVYLGGLDTVLAEAVRTSLVAAGFHVETHADQRLQGTVSRNICNQGVRGVGVQMEIAAGLRRTFFKSLRANDRATTTEALRRFSNAVRAGLRNAGALCDCAPVDVPPATLQPQNRG